MFGFHLIPEQKSVRLLQLQELTKLLSVIRLSIFSEGDLDIVFNQSSDKRPVQQQWKWMMPTMWNSKTFTHRFLSAPVHSYWGTTHSCRSASLPTSPPPPACSHWWCHPWRRRARPHWSAGRQSAPWPAPGHTHCPPTCPGNKENKKHGDENSVCLLLIHISFVAVVVMVTHQASVLRLQQLRGASVSVERIKRLDPQGWGVLHTHTVSRDT